MSAVTGKVKEDGGNKESLHTFNAALKAIPTRLLAKSSMETKTTLLKEFTAADFLAEWPKGLRCRQLASSIGIPVSDGFYNRNFLLMCVAAIDGEVY